MHREGENVYDDEWVEWAIVVVAFWYAFVNALLVVSRVEDLTSVPHHFWHPLWDPFPLREV